MMELSVIIPVYKINEKMLRECIESLTKQDVAEMEIIIVDDGSPDNCGKVCDEYADRDKNIKVIHKKNEGVSIARNVGIETARGQYICFVDPDDKIRKKSLGDVLNKAREKNADILCFKYMVAGEEKSDDGSLDLRDITPDIEKINRSILEMKDNEYNYGACWGKIIKKSFIDDNNLRFVRGIQKAQDRIFMFDCYNKNLMAFSYDFYGYIYTADNDSSICNRLNVKIVDILEKTYYEFKEHVEKIKEIDYSCELNYLLVAFLMEYNYLMLGKKEYKKRSQRVGELRKILEKDDYQNAIRTVDLSRLRKKSQVMCLLLRLKLYYACIFMFEISGK